MEKSDFWDVKRLDFLWPKKVSFRSRTLLNIICSLTLTENNSRKKTLFFDQKHGLTPLEKCDFLGLWKITFLRAKQRFLFYLAHYLALFLVLFWPKTTQEKKYFLWTKAWVNPFGKMRFLGLKKIDFLWPKMVSFLSWTLLTLFLVLFRPKTTQEKKLLFLTKSMG